MDGEGDDEQVPSLLVGILVRHDVPESEQVHDLHQLLALPRSLLLQLSLFLLLHLLLLLMDFVLPVILEDMLQLLPILDLLPELL